MKVSGKTIIQTVLLIIALGLVVWGIADGEARAVFIKAVRICMECIGIG